MTTFLYTWDSTFAALPPDPEDALQGALRIRDTKAAVAERMKIDHRWHGDGNDGIHTKVTMLQGAQPATPPAGQVVMWTPVGATTPSLLTSAGAVQKVGELPVGFVFISVVSTNPATLLGYGTWSAFGQGRVLVGINPGEVEFNSLRQTGGAKSVTLTTTEMPVHSHGVTDPGHSHGLTAMQSNGGNSGVPSGGNGVAGTNSALTTANATGVTVQNAGSGAAHYNIQPYIVVYMWERIA